MASSKQQRAALERIIDLALFLAAYPARPLPGAMIKTELYDKLFDRPQSEAAFRRMFDRDRQQLEAAGLHIAVSAEGTYTFDPGQNYLADLKLSPAERAAAALAAAALVDDVLFPLPVALRLALIKLSRVLDENGALLDDVLPVHSDLARGGGSRQAEDGAADGELDGAAAKTGTTATPAARWTELIIHAQLESRCLEMRYRNSAGRVSVREVAPYGLHLLGSQWYVVGLDSLHEEVRVFQVARILELQVSDARFTLPDDFSVERWMQLPFRLSNAPRDHEASVLIPEERSFEVEKITRGKGSLEPTADGRLLWKITYPTAQLDRLVRYALEQGLSFAADSAREQTALRNVLEKVAAAHA